MKQLCMIFAFIMALSPNVFAQEDIRESIANMFSELAPQYLGHNCLRDRGIEYVDIDYFSGHYALNDSNYCQPDIFGSMLLTIKTMNPTSGWDVDNILSYQKSNNSLNRCIIGSVVYQYYYIVENALKDGLIKYENDKVYNKYDATGKFINPYDTDYILGFFPSDTVFNENVTFEFPSITWVNNYGGTLQFDAGDGRGFRAISQNTTVSVNYSSSGIYTLKFKLTGGGSTLESHARIRVIQQTGSRSENNEDFYVTASYNGTVVEGEVQRCDNPGKTPLIYVEGFDVDFGFNETESQSNGYGNQNLYSILKSNSPLHNYDVYYLDLKDPTLEIEANAALLEAAILEINEKIGSSQKSIVFGSSMGGLIARYALRNMELNGKKHNCSTLICQDTPNLGANVPVGVLYAVHSLEEIFSKYLSKIPVKLPNINGILGIVRSKAARQMMFNYVNENGVIDNSEHNQFLNKLHNMGYPKGDDGSLRCLAISNGNTAIMGVDEPFIDKSFDLSLTELSEAIAFSIRSIFGLTVAYLTEDVSASLLSMMPGKNSVRAGIYIYSSGSSVPECHIKLTYKKKLLWVQDITRTFYEYKKYYPENMPNYDLAKCSYFYLNIDKPFNFDLPKAFFKLKNGKGPEIKSHIPFIPTVSALDIGEGKVAITNEDLQRDYQTDVRPSAPKHTPFHDFYITKPSEEHISFNTGINDWLTKHLKMDIDGDPIAFTGSKYVLRNSMVSGAVTWSIPESDIATIDNKGIVTVKKHGYFTIKAVLSNGIEVYRTFMAEFPKFRVESSYQSNSYHVRFAEYGETDNVYNNFKDHILIETARTTGNPVTWSSINHNVTQYFPITERGETFNVYYRAKYVGRDNTVHYSPLYNTTICTSLPYIIEPNYIKVRGTSILNTISLKSNPNYPNSIPDDLKIYNVLTEGSEPITGVHGITSLTLKAENLFSETQLYNAKFNYTGPISVTFQVRNNKGNLIQQFNVSMIK